MWALLWSFWTGKAQQNQVREIIRAIVSQKIVFGFRETGSILRGVIKCFTCLQTTRILNKFDKCVCVCVCVCVWISGISYRETEKFERSEIFTISKPFDASETFSSVVQCFKHHDMLLKTQFLISDYMSYLSSVCEYSNISNVSLNSDSWETSSIL